MYRKIECELLLLEGQGERREDLVSYQSRGNRSFLGTYSNMIASHLQCLQSF